MHFRPVKGSDSRHPTNRETRQTPSAGITLLNLEGGHSHLTLRPCRADEILQLRYRILRFGLAFEEARFDGDDLPTSRHFAAMEPGDVAVSCATFMLNAWEGAPAWQLRGMATEAGYQGKGVGTAVLKLAESTVVATGLARLLWCNARVPALAFYERQGWAVTSEPFDIPTAGPHRKMLKRV